MFKSSNQFFKPKKIDYQQLINVWYDDQKRIDVVKRLMITDKNFKLEKLKMNPVYKDVYEVITIERDKELIRLDNSILWSRKFKKKQFLEFIIPFSIYSLVIIPYIFYKVLHKRILEHHVKSGYTAENLKPYGYWNLDFSNKDIYPDSVIKLYFNIKKVNFQKQLKEEKIENYSNMFVENIVNGYLNDLSSRRASLGFNDDEV